MDTKSLLEYVESRLPVGSNFKVRIPYTEVTLEFDEIPTITFVYLKSHAFCIDSAFDHVEGHAVIDGKLTFRISGEDVSHVTT